MLSSFKCKPGDYELQLKPNTALVEIFAAPGSNFSYLRDECQNCSWTFLCKLHEHTKVLFNTTSSTKYRIEDSQGNAANGYYHFENQGHYYVNSTFNSTKVTIIKEPEDPISGIILLLFFACLLLVLERGTISTWHNKICRLWARVKAYLFKDEEFYYKSIERGHGNLLREDSVDATRGFFIILMIFVNYGGGSFAVFEHVPWRGFTLADAVFPGFIFISGVSYGLHVLNSNNLSLGFTRKLFARLFKMAIYGLILNRSQSFETCRFGGVLQRIAAVVFLFHLIRFLMYNGFNEPARTERDNFIIYNVSTLNWKDYLAVGSLVGLFTLMFTLIPYTNCKPNYYGPGGISDSGLNGACFGGFAKLLDEKIFGAKHLYERPTCKDVYQCSGNFDPEGIFGTIMALTNVLAGYTMGVHYRHSTRESVSRHIMFIGTILTSSALGYALDFWQIIPIVKNIWTLSYALLGTSCAAITLYVLFLLINKWQLMNFDILRTCGVHSLEIYIFHMIVRGLFPFNWDTWSTTLAQTAMALWGTVCCIGVAMYLEANQFKVDIVGPIRWSEEVSDQENEALIEE